LSPLESAPPVTVALMRLAILVTRQITFPLIYVLDETRTHLVVTERLDADEAIAVPKNQIISLTYSP